MYTVVRIVNPFDDTLYVICNSAEIEDLETLIREALPRFNKESGVFADFIQTLLDESTVDAGVEDFRTINLEP